MDRKWVVLAVVWFAGMCLSDFGNEPFLHIFGGLASGLASAWAFLHARKGQGR